MEHDPRTMTYCREAAYERQGGLCLVCFLAMLPGQYHGHHRQRRSAVGHCRCNVVALHPTCHVQGPLAVHDHPETALSRGLIVSAFGDPRLVPVEVVYPWRAWVRLCCDGTLETAALTPSL